MRILNWNYRGLGNPPIVLQCQKKAQEHKPDIIFLMETKLVQKKGRDILEKCGFSNGWEFPREGLSGGILLGWYQNVKLNIQYGSKHLIHVDLFDHKGIKQLSVKGKTPDQVRSRPCKEFLTKTGRFSSKWQLAEIGKLKDLALLLKLLLWQGSLSSEVQQTMVDNQYIW